MDETVLAPLRSFENVWGRVTGTAGQEMDAPAVLRRLMCRVQRLCESEKALANVAKSAAGTLLRLAGENARILKRLKAEYFLLTGEIYTPGAACALTRGALTSLRTAYLAASECSEDFAASAREAGAELGRLFDKYAAEQAGHVRELKGLVLRAMDANST